MPDRLTIGLISDTHGLLWPEALGALHGSDFIIHAGDVGHPRIIDRLGEIAPVTAVRGNVDKGDWADSLPLDAVLRVGAVLIYVIHNINELDIDPADAAFAVVVFGHSHKPASYEQAGVRFVNPGSAGPRRFSLPVFLGRLIIQDEVVTAELFELDLA